MAQVHVTKQVTDTFRVDTAHMVVHDTLPAELFWPPWGLVEALSSGSRVEYDNSSCVRNSENG